MFVWRAGYTQYVRYQVQSKIFPSNADFLGFMERGYKNDIRVTKTTYKCSSSGRPWLSGASVQPVQ